MAASSSAAASSSIVELDEAAALLDTATSAYFDDGDSAAGAAAAAFSWPVAEKITSTLTGNGQLRSLCTLMKVPKDYKTFFAHSKPACEAPKEGTDAICVYADAFDAGMRLPLHDFHAAVLRHYGLAPSQLAPYAWRYMAAFVLLCADAGVEPQLPVFQQFFSIVTNKGDARGWHHFKPYLQGQRRLFNGKMPRYAGWKSKFFFLQCPPATPWSCPTKWGKPSSASVCKPAVMTEAMRTAIEKLLDRAGNTGIDVVPFLSRRTLPVGRQTTLPLQLTPVKVESAAANSVAGMDQTRKRKSPEPVTPPPPPPQGSISAGEGSASATRGLHQLARMAEAELDRQEQELNATKNEVARLKKEHAAKEQELGRLGDELRAVKDAHNAEVFNLKEELQAANAAHAAEVSQLAEELEQAKNNHAVDIAQLGEERAAEVQAVKVQCQREIISLQHNSVIEQSKRYVMGLRDMRQLAVATYPDVIKPSDLQHKLLSRYPDQQGFTPQEGPLNE
ncbi:hypothetical protein EJB05_47217, partial [Eragrostis curvula]